MLSKIAIIAAVFLLSACSDGTTQSEALSTTSSQDQFLFENAAREGVSVTESGLQYEVLRASVGAMPSADSIITAHYKGELIDGAEFDSSYGRGEAITLPLAGTIPGWVEGVQLMSVGFSV